MSSLSSQQQHKSDPSSSSAPASALLNSSDLHSFFGTSDLFAAIESDIMSTSSLDRPSQRSSLLLATNTNMDRMTPQISSPTSPRRVSDLQDLEKRASLQITNSKGSAQPAAPSPPARRAKPMPTPKEAPAAATDAAADADAADDHQPAKRAVNSGQIVNARALVEDGDPSSEEEGSNAKGKKRGDAGVPGSGRRDDKAALGAASGKGASAGSKDGALGGEPSHNSLSRSLDFEQLLSSTDTVKLSSTPDRLRSIETVKKSASAPRYQAKEAKVQKDENNLLDFLKTTGPDDPTGRNRPRPTPQPSDKPLKGVLKGSSTPNLSTPGAPAAPTAAAASPATAKEKQKSASDIPITPSKEAAAAVLSASSPAVVSPTQAALPAPPLPPQATKPAKKDDAVAAAVDDDSDFEDDYFNPKKKKKDAEMSLAEFLKSSGPPEPPAPATGSLTRKGSGASPVPPKKAPGAGSALRLFSLSRKGTPTASDSDLSAAPSAASSAASSPKPAPANVRSPTLPDRPLPAAASATATEAKATAPPPPAPSRGRAADKPAPADAPAAVQPSSFSTSTKAPTLDSSLFPDVGGARNRSASQSSMERLVTSLFSSASSSLADPTPPPVPALPTGLSARRNSKKQGAAAPAPTAASTQTDPAPTPAPAILDAHRPDAPLDALARALAALDPAFAPHLDDALDALRADTPALLPPGFAEGELAIPRLEAVAVEAAVEVADAACQTIHDVLVAEFEDVWDDEVVVVEEVGSPAAGMHVPLQAMRCYAVLCDGGDGCYVPSCPSRRPAAEPEDAPLEAAPLQETPAETAPLEHAAALEDAAAEVVLTPRPTAGVPLHAMLCYAPLCPGPTSNAPCYAPACPYPRPGPRDAASQTTPHDHAASAAVQAGPDPAHAHAQTDPRDEADAAAQTDEPPHVVDRASFEREAALVRRVRDLEAECRRLREIVGGVAGGRDRLARALAGVGRVVVQRAVEGR